MSEPSDEPGRDPERVRPTDDALLHTGAERPIDPEDLIRARGREPTPELVEKVRQVLWEEGPSAIERVLP